MLRATDPIEDHQIQKTRSGADRIARAFGIRTFLRVSPALRSYSFRPQLTQSLAAASPVVVTGRSQPGQGWTLSS